MAAFVVAFLWSVRDDRPPAYLPLPRSMAALGDSISRATNACCRYGDSPEHAWSTGSAEEDGVLSHYERILPREPAIEGRNHNLARAGATMEDLEDQAARAVGLGPEYVTILMGANDACTSSRRTMTTVREFRAGFRRAMTTLAGGLPEARIFVASIPNTYRLWQVYGDDPAARAVWRISRACPSLLSPDNSEEDRQAVLTKLQAFNDVLARVCGRYPNCRFDDHAVFGFRFDRRHVSTLDYFHPSLAGQAELASLTWERSWWPDETMSP